MFKEKPEKMYRKYKYFALKQSNGGVKTGHALAMQLQKIWTPGVLTAGVGLHARLFQDTALCPAM